MPLALVPKTYIILYRERERICNKMAVFLNLAAHVRVFMNHNGTNFSFFCEHIICILCLNRCVSTLSQIPQPCLYILLPWHDVKLKYSIISIHFKASVLYDYHIGGRITLFLQKSVFKGVLTLWIFR